MGDRLGERVGDVALVILAVLVVAMTVVAFRSVGQAESDARETGADAPHVREAPSSEGPSREAPAGEPSGADRMVVLGDSFLAGAGSSSRENAMGPQVADGLGLRLVNLSATGTGYTNDGPPGDAGEPFPDRVDEVVTAAAGPTALVVVAGGQSDFGHVFERDEASIADERAAARAVLSRLAAALEADVDVVVVGPYWAKQSPAGGADDIARVVSEEADAAGFAFVDPIAEGWITDGNRGRYLNESGTNPTPAGHDYLAGRLEEALRAAARPA